MHSHVLYFYINNTVLLVNFKIFHNFRYIINIFFGFFQFFSFKICADYEFLLRKKLNARYIETPTIAMQVGGVSNTIRGLWESFKVKRYCKSIPLLLNVYYLTKGVIGYYMRKIKIIN